MSKGKKTKGATLRSTKTLAFDLPKTADRKPQFFTLPAGETVVAAAMLETIKATPMFKFYSDAGVISEIIEAAKSEEF